MSRLLARDPHTLSRLTLDAVVVLRPGADDPVVVEGAGPEVWVLLHDPRRPDELIDLPRFADREPVAVADAVERLLDCGAVFELPDQADG